MSGDSESNILASIISPSHSTNLDSQNHSVNDLQENEVIQENQNNHYWVTEKSSEVSMGNGISNANSLQKQIE